MRKRGFIAVRNILLLVILMACLTDSLLFAKNNKPSTIQAQFEKLKAEGKQRVIVKFKDEIDPSVVKKYGRYKRTLKIINSAIAEIDIDKIELLKAEGVVEDVVPDMIIKIPEVSRSSVPVEAGSSQMQMIQTESLDAEPLTDWNLQYEGITATVRWNNLTAGLNSEAAWNRYGLDGAGIKIAILDTGIQYTLADLSNNYLGGYDFEDYDDDPLPPDATEYHGTEVACLAVGEGVDAVVAPAYKAGFYALRVGTKTGSSVSNVISGIEWSMDPDGDPNTDDKADIINMSLAIYDEDNVGNPIWFIIKQNFEEACNAAYNAGIVLVAGSGNTGYDYSSYPAAFDNVISVGRHGEDQTIPVTSNGGVDVVAPGKSIYVVDPDDTRWFNGGTSFAAPHVCSLIALIIQHARQNNIEVNNGYVWECIKHSAIDLGLDPVYQGKGKAWAAETLPTSDPNDGAIDLLANNWPIDFNIDFTTPKYERNSTPAYYIDDTMTQDVNVINNTDIYGGYSDDITNLTLTTHQNYYQREDSNSLPGVSNQVFSGLSINDGNEIGVSYSYPIPAETVSGLNHTTIEFNFNFSGNNRQMHIAYNDPNFLWLSVNELTADFEPDGDVDFADYSVLSGQWQQSGVLSADIAPEPVDGTVNSLDLMEFVSQWLEDAMP